MDALDLARDRVSAFLAMTEAKDDTDTAIVMLSHAARILEDRWGAMLTLAAMDRVVESAVELRMMRQSGGGR